MLCSGVNTKRRKLSKLLQTKLCNVHAFVMCHVKDQYTSELTYHLHVLL